MYSKKKSTRIDHAVRRTVRKQTDHCEANQANLATVAQKVEILILLNKPCFSLKEKESHVPGLYQLSCQAADELIDSLKKLISERTI